MRRRAAIFLTGTAVVGLVGRSYGTPTGRPRHVAMLAVARSTRGCRLLRRVLVYCRPDAGHAAHGPARHRFLRVSTRPGTLVGASCAGLALAILLVFTGFLPALVDDGGAPSRTSSPAPWFSTPRIDRYPPATRRPRGRGHDPAQVTSLDGADPRGRPPGLQRLVRPLAVRRARGARARGGAGDRRVPARQGARCDRLPETRSRSGRRFRVSFAPGRAARCRAPLKLAGHAAGLASLVVRARRTRPDIVALAVGAAPAARCTCAAPRRPLVRRHDLHGARRAAAPERGRRLRAGAPCTARCDRVITHSENGRTRLLDEVGVDPSRVVVIPHPVLADDRAPGAADGQAAGERVLFFGLLRPDKGLDVLVEALPALVAQVPGARLEVVGSPRMAIEPLRERAAALGVSERIAWDLRFVSDAEADGRVRPRVGRVPAVPVDRELGRARRGAPARRGARRDGGRRSAGDVRALRPARPGARRRSRGARTGAGACARGCPMRARASAGDGARPRGADVGACGGNTRDLYAEVLAMQPRRPAAH